MHARRIGVEEELLLIDPATGRTRSVSDRAVRADPERGEDGLDQELFLEQIETSSRPTSDLGELRADLRAERLRASTAAHRAGAEILAVPLPLLADVPADVTPKQRYERMLDIYGEIGRDTVACGMHVHVEVVDDDEAVRIVDGVRPWLPLVMALSANSPFHLGRDTGHHSWRGQVWDAWPSAGPVEPFGDAAGYRVALDRFIASGAAIDEGMIYFDARLARSYPTVEVRVADVCTDLDDTLVVAAVVRALAETAAHESDPSVGWRVELLRAARWRARHDGTSDRLLDPVTARLVGAREAMDTLLEHLGPALARAGDATLVADGVERLLSDGTGAARQRRAAGDDTDLRAVLDDLLARTQKSMA